MLRVSRYNLLRLNATYHRIAQHVQHITIEASQLIPSLDRQAYDGLLKQWAANAGATIRVSNMTEANGDWYIRTKPDGEPVDTSTLRNPPDSHICEARRSHNLFICSDLGRDCPPQVCSCRKDRGWSLFATRADIEQAFESYLSITAAESVPDEEIVDAWQMILPCLWRIQTVSLVRSWDYGGSYLRSLFSSSSALSTNVVVHAIWPASILESPCRAFVDAAMNHNYQFLAEVFRQVLVNTSNVSKASLDVRGHTNFYKVAQPGVQESEVVLKISEAAGQSTARADLELKRTHSSTIGTFPFNINLKLAVYSNLPGCSFSESLTTPSASTIHNILSILLCRPTKSQSQSSIMALRIGLLDLPILKGSHGVVEKIGVSSIVHELWKQFWIMMQTLKDRSWTVHVDKIELEKMKETLQHVPTFFDSYRNGNPFNLDLLMPLEEAKLPDTVGPKRLSESVLTDFVQGKTQWQDSIFHRTDNLFETEQ